MEPRAANRSRQELRQAHEGRQLRERGARLRVAQHDDVASRAPHPLQLGDAGTPLPKVDDVEVRALDELD